MHEVAFGSAGEIHSQISCAASRMSLSRHYGNAISVSTWFSVVVVLCSLVEISTDALRLGRLEGGSGTSVACFSSETNFSSSVCKLRNKYLFWIEDSQDPSTEWRQFLPFAARTSHVLCINGIHHFVIQ